jgi:hypothetical protein
MLAFRGACGEPSRRFAPLEVSPVPLLPQESRTFHSNQLVNEENEKMSQMQQSFREEPNKKRHDLKSFYTFESSPYF